MHGDSRVMVWVCLATTSLPAPCLSTFYSPLFSDEPKKREPAGSRSIFYYKLNDQSTAPRLRQTTISTNRMPSSGATHFSQRT